MQATVQILSNPFKPQSSLRAYAVRRKYSVSTLVKRYQVDLTQPVLCYYNNVPLLRKHWPTTIVKDSDEVNFVTVLQGGGGGSNPLRMVLTVALLYYAGPLAGSLGQLTGIQSQLGLSLLKAGISFVGNALINALTATPALPKSQQQANLAAASPTYTLAAQGNQARIGQAIPVIYGRMKVFPDFAAQPYAEFENNDQYLYQMFVVTQGKALIDPAEVYIEDSPINAFASGDYQIEILQPGQKSTLFPTAVYNTAEVSGQEIDGSTSVGPFAINPSLTSVNKLAFDIALTRGLYYANDEGGLSNRTVTFEFFYTPIDDAGTPTGAEVSLGQQSITANTQNVIRRTYQFDVPAGRYMGKAIRIGGKDTSARVANDVNVIGMRGYASDQIDYGDVTMLVVKLKATNNISSQSARKINCIAQRMLSIPTYNATTESYDWSVPQVTQSICWAIADMCKASYGAGVDDSRINLGQLVALESILAARGDTFNGVFDSTQTFWDAITLACRPGRMKPYVQSGMLNVVRDGLQTIPSALFTSRNMVAGSFKLSYIMPTEDTADCIDVEYFDETVWKWRTVRCVLDAGTQSKPFKVKFFGVTNRSQAWREGVTIAAGNRHLRKRISYETELEGQMLSMGMLVALQNPIPKWGQAADVVSYVGGVFTVNEALEWTVGAQHYVMLRRANGSAHEVREVIKGATDSQFTLASGLTIDFAPSTDFSQERTQISFGPSGNVVQLAKVLSITPADDGRVQVVTVNDDPRVHAADGEPVPPDLYNYAIPAPKTKPVLTDFNVTQTGSGIAPSVLLSWQPAVGASRYIIEKSTDNTNWETIGEVTQASYSFVGSIGLLWLRVAAMGALLGPYVTKSIEIGLIPPPADVPSGVVEANGQTFDFKWSEVVDCDGYYIEVLNAGSVKRSFYQTANNFAYTLENAIADGGPWRNVTATIKAYKGNVYSQNALSLAGVNAAPAAPTLTLVPGAKNISVTISKSDETDYAGTLLYAGDTAGFTPGPTNLIYEGIGTFFLHAITTQKYYKAAHYDTYGKTGLNYSTVVTASPNTGFGVYIEYSVDGATAWHSTFAAGDIYMRQKVDADGVWSDAIRITGIQGPQGIPGTPGANGVTYYTWVKYADSPTTGMSDSPTGKAYLGIASNKTTATESSNYADYTWSLIKGTDGIPGTPGANGVTYYTWVKYADSPTTGMSDSPTGKAYLGIASNKTTATESSNYADYTWSLIKGTDGIPGAPGADGVTYYTWLKYADTPTTGMSDSPTGKAYIGLAVNKTTATESSNYADYTWQLVKGADGIPGVDGKAYWIVNPTPVIVKNEDGTFTPSSVTYTLKVATGNAAPADYAGRFVISTSPDGLAYTTRYTSAANESSRSYALRVADRYIKCQAYAAGGTSTLLDEEVSVVQVVTENANLASANYVAALSNEAHVVPADNAGVVSSFGGAVSTMTLYRNGVDDTSNWTFSKVDSGVTSALSGSTVTVSAMPGDNGFVDIAATPVSTVNFIQNSTFTTGWTVSGTTVTQNAGTAPDGTLTLVKLEDTHISSYDVALTNISNSALVTNQIVYSIFVEKDNIPASERYPLFRVLAVGVTPAAYFEITMDTKSGRFRKTTNAEVASTFENIEVGVIDCGNFWRAWITGKCIASGVTTLSIQNYPAVEANDNLTPSEQVAVGSIKVWGPMLHLGNRPLPYTPYISPITKRFALSKARQGLQGTNGVNGSRTAILEMYKWAASTPTTFPAGTSTYTWATGQFTAPATTNGWSLTPPAPVAGQTLYVARTIYADSNTSATSSVTWNATSASTISSAGTNGTNGKNGTNGTNGINGTRTAVVEMYKWSASVPTTFPSGSSTYTWSTGAFTAPATLNGWSLMPGAAVAGQTLYGCSVSYADTNTTTTSSITWNTTTAYALGAAGTNGATGATGPAGDSRRIAYTKTTLATLAATPATISTSGSTSFPANGSWGAGTVWSGTSPTLAAGETQWQSDGLYSAASNTTVWGKPYLSSLKVGSLSALSANLGTMTAGNITLDTAGFLRGGQTAYNTGTGFWMGYAGGAYKMSFGNTTKGVTWDGTDFTIKGDLLAGSININNLFLVSSTGAVTIKSSATGYPRREQTNQVDKMWDAAGTLRLKLGNLDL